MNSFKEVSVWGALFMQVQTRLDSGMVELRSPVELEMVHRALMAARFAESPEDPVLLGSPYLAVIHSSVMDELISAYRNEGRTGIAGRWEQWRELTRDRREWMIVKERLASTEMGWGRLAGDEKKRELVRTCLKPFNVDQEMVTEMVEQLNREVG